MALIGEIYKEGEGEAQKDAFLAKFTNGTYEQIKELAVFLRKEGFAVSDDLTEDDLKEVVRVAISYLVSSKENKEKSSEK